MRNKALLSRPRATMFFLIFGSCALSRDPLGDRPMPLAEVHARSFQMPHGNITVLTLFVAI